MSEGLEVQELPFCTDFSTKSSGLQSLTAALEQLLSASCYVCISHHKSWYPH